MVKPAARSLSNYTRDALALFGNLIREGRIAKRMTAEALAERVGISRALLHRIESGDPRSNIGAVFEAAAILGVPLFDADVGVMTALAGDSREKKALLPKRVRTAKAGLKDDF
ncbi:MAG TPA: transcriptional regulator [Desulfovibrio sp.]|nr:transcriptional regulator [Desulfovibrio sp.]